ncbi:hypothetical protein LZ012_00220 [Dechloromonas sp. XY25]|uniref:Uncharacterized protein n=1 Tax=Dechloromonas hankyongensis TaxID=2908002 RepID=A0ABS9JWW9_9RHOO|nr:hypothetical protein [Dechloromonas hankyongensis]MCG2575413.1 hypothetical protein [Dechloromonas hankyongensis]
MSDSRTQIIGSLSIAANVIYKLTVLLALLWIGYGLQDVANALYAAPNDACAVDSSGDGAEQEQDGQPQIMKPLLRGAT